MFTSPTYISKYIKGARQKAQRLGALAAFAEDLVLVPSIYIGAYSQL